MSYIESFYPDSLSVMNSARPAFRIGIRVNEPNHDFLVEFWVSRTASPSADAGAFYLGRSINVPWLGYERTVTEAFVLPDGIELGSGRWYYQTRVTNLTTGSMTVPVSNQVVPFDVFVIPDVTLLYPENNRWIKWVNVAGNVNVSWKYSGYSDSDIQTKYQVLAYRSSDNLQIYNSGVIVGSAQTHSFQVSSTYKDVDLKWGVVVWNKWDNLRSSPTTVFRLADPGTVAITAPTASQVMSTGLPSVTLNTTLTGGRTVKKIFASAWEAGGNKVWEKTVEGTWASGASVTVNDTFAVFKSGQSYNYRVSIEDSAGLRSGDAGVNFSVAFTAPNTPGAGSVDGSDYDTEGYITVTWPNMTVDTDFYAWEVERMSEYLDPTSSTVTETVDWKPIGRLYSSAGSYEFRDYTAPSGYINYYRVKQIALKFGSEVDSATTLAGAVSVKTDQYWLFGGTNGATSGVDIINLYNVTADSFTEETEMAEFPILGRGRYVEKGDELGARGTLEMKIRGTGDVSPRTKRKLLVAFKSAYSVGYLRNPFGDLYKVYVGDMSVSRIAGVGESEFCDLTIPYTEVAE